MGPSAFLLGVGFTFYATLRSGIALHNNGSVLNFFHLWGSITLMIMTIMGLMNACKI